MNVPGGPATTEHSLATDAVAAADPADHRVGAGTTANSSAADSEFGIVVRLPLGLAILAAERLRTGPGAGPSALNAGGAFLVGLADAAVGTGARVTGVLVTTSHQPMSSATALAAAGLRQPPLRVMVGPARRLWAAIVARATATVERGRAISTMARVDAVTFLEAQLTGGMTLVRQQVLPPVIDDLTASPQIRALAVAQTQGAFADAARELRQRSASADGRIEAGVHRLLARARPVTTDASRANR
jgi:hypothetical protein